VEGCICGTRASWPATTFRPELVALLSLAERVAGPSGEGAEFFGLDQIEAAACDALQFFREFIVGDGGAVLETATPVVRSQGSTGCPTARP
jgi:hypothetical protein